MSGSNFSFCMRDKRVRLDGSGLHWVFVSGIESDPFALLVL